MGLREFIYLHIRVHYRPFNASVHTANVNKSQLALHLLVPQYPTCSNQQTRLLSKGNIFIQDKESFTLPMKLVNVRTAFKHSAEQKAALHWEFVSDRIFSTHYFSICSYSISLRQASCRQGCCVIDNDREQSDLISSGLVSSSLLPGLARGGGIVVEPSEDMRGNFMDWVLFLFVI